MRRRKNSENADDINAKLHNSVFRKSLFTHIALEMTRVGMLIYWGCHWQRKFNVSAPAETEYALIVKWI